jgi:hypothetical protein
MTFSVDFTSIAFAEGAYDFPTSIAYSKIGYEFGPGAEFCCDEVKAVCPTEACGASLCLFCQDGCESCGATIDFSR